MPIITQADSDAMESIDSGAKKLPEGVLWLDDKTTRALNAMEQRKADKQEILMAINNLSSQLEGQKNAILSIAAKLDADSLASSSYEDDAIAEMV